MSENKNPPKPDLESLKQKALAATQGKWFAAKNNRGFGVRVQSAWLSAFGMGEGDAAYIAAVSPDVILDLIERLEGMEEALKELQLGHVHAPDLKHIRKLGDSYGWCDYCSLKVNWGPGIAEEALAKWGTK